MRNVNLLNSKLNIKIPYRTTLTVIKFSIAVFKSHRGTSTFYEHKVTYRKRNETPTIRTNSGQPDFLKRNKTKITNARTVLVNCNYLERLTAKSLQCNER